MSWFLNPANVWAALVAFAAGQLAASALYTVLVRLMLTAHERWEQAAHAQLLETVRKEISGAELARGRLVHVINGMERRLSSLEDASERRGKAG